MAARSNALSALYRLHWQLAAAEPTVGRLGDDAEESQYAFVELRDAAEHLWNLWDVGAVDRPTTVNGRWSGRRVPANVLACLESAAADLRAAVDAELPQATSGTTTRRRRKGRQKARALTEKQAEAVQLVGEHKGNRTAAAEAAGVSRQVMTRRYEAAMRKLGRSALKHRTVPLPQDRRGQSSVDRDVRHG